MRLTLALLSLTALLCACAPDDDLHSTGTNLLLGDSAYAAWTGHDLPHDLTEQERVRTHLAFVEQHLQMLPTDHLTQAQRAARARHLARLREYWVAGRFPRNDGHPDARRPTFIDDTGAICAVGYLIEQELGRAVLADIAAHEKYDFIAQIDDPALHAWQPTSGLTMTELAMIQPSYHWEEPIEPPRRPYPPPHVDLEALAQRARDAAQPGVERCFDRFDRAQRHAHWDFTATVTWDVSGEVSAVGFEIPSSSPLLNECVSDEIQRHRLPINYPGASPFFTTRLRFTGPRLPIVPQGRPADLSAGLERIDRRARACYAPPNPSQGTALVPLTIAIRTDGRVAWARIAPQHRLLGPLKDPQIHQCVLDAAQSEIFAPFQGPLFEARLHLSLPSPA
jgi:hypothetical protein